MSKKGARRTGGHKKRSAAGAPPTPLVRRATPPALADRLAAATDFRGNRVTAPKKATAQVSTDKDKGGKKEKGGKRKGSSGH